MNDIKILNFVIDEFKKISLIPRSSGNEKEISEYLFRYFSQRGYCVEKDKYNNIIVDLPATAGKENAPRTILQAHMDMVCIAKEGKRYNPIKDSITVCSDEDFLWADGTSLGADNGIGIAEILYILKYCKEHGPIRAIFTVDEEAGMTGAIALDKKYVQDVKFLINCDSEQYDVLTVGSAGSVNLDFIKKLNYELSPLGNTFCLKVSGLLGGHSGEDIHYGRANAIILLARILYALDNAGINYSLAEIEGGVARNAIPSQAHATIVTTASFEKVQTLLKIVENRFKKIFANSEKNLEIELSLADKSEKVISAKDTKTLLTLCLNLHSGVFAMSQLNPNLVETSANLGVLKIENEIIKVSFFPRSLVFEKILDFCQQVKILSETLGFTLKKGTISPVWEENCGVLSDIILKNFLEQNKKPMSIKTIHAGLECGWFFQKNHKLDIVSIGTTMYDIHTPNEKVEIKTIVPIIKLLEKTIHDISLLQN